MKQPNKSKARALYWSTRTPEQRSEHMSKMIKARLSKMTPEERKAQATMGAKARWEKEKAVQ